jgi:HK97 gp10 family phage protein
MIDFKIEGVGLIVENLRKVKDRASDKVVTKIVRQESKVIVASARARVPVDSGMLRSQVGFIKKNDARYPNKALIGVNYQFHGAKRGNSAYYGHIVEYGGKSIRRTARPFMAPAFEMHRARVSQNIIKRVREKLNIQDKT